MKLLHFERPQRNLKKVPHHVIIRKSFSFPFQLTGHDRSNIFPVKSQHQKETQECASPQIASDDRKASLGTIKTPGGQKRECKSLVEGGEACLYRGQNLAPCQCVRVLCECFVCVFCVRVFVYVFQHFFVCRFKLFFVYRFQVFCVRVSTFSRVSVSLEYVFLCKCFRSYSCASDFVSAF